MLTSRLKASLVLNPTVTYIGSVQNINNASSYTFNGTNIGGPGLIVFIVSGSETGGGTRTLSSLTVGGVASTIHSNLASQDFAFLTSYRVTSGSTANIVVTLSSTVARCLVAVFRLQNLASDTPKSVADTYSATTRTSASVSLTGANNGVAVSGVTHSSGGLAFTWTNATEVFDTVVESNTTTSGARRDFSSATVTITAATTALGRIYMSAGVWG